LRREKNKKEVPFPTEIAIHMLDTWGFEMSMTVDPGRDTRVHGVWQRTDMGNVLTRSSGVEMEMEIEKDRKQSKEKGAKKKTTKR